MQAAKISTPPVFPVVGLGASAGGLEASTHLLQSLPRDTGMAFVLIQHLDPRHESMLSEILSRSTPMPVREVKSPTPVEPNHIYVNSRGVDLYIRNRVIQVTPRKMTHEAPMPIDYFFRSLAEDLGNKAIGVILSGTGSDGSLGLKTIKAEGGITFAQDEKSAKYDGMPLSAVNSGCVDFVMPPDAVARELSRIGNHSYMAPRPAPGAELIPVPEGTLGQILNVVRGGTGVDLTQYKPNTIRRRILRRMMLNKIESLDQYLERLKIDSAEVHALYEDILINVTQFFRDAETFEALKKDFFPKLVREQEPNPSLRIWVPGCSTGEEVYSLAIALIEYLEEHELQATAQFFGTDISDTALEKARAGLYTDNIAADISAQRLKHFFAKTDRGYQISKRVRELCIFARQNLTKDPPFSKLDLISCRNVLIYLGPMLQKKVLPVFHYALKPTGYLLLGSSETIGAYADLFTMVDKKHKVFAKKLALAQVPVEFEGRARSAEAPQAGADIVTEAGSLWNVSELQKEADRIILSRFGPPGVVVNEDYEVIQFRGQTGTYLEPPPGPASYNVMKMAREGLLADLRSALQRARTSDTAVRKEGMRVKYNGSFRQFNLEVIPMRRLPYPGRSFMVLFHPLQPSGGKKTNVKQRRQPAITETEEIKLLRQELAVTKETLQAIIEEQEASNEELRSANEEVHSSNEELQSTNEELETAEEELQSSNEELNTVNEEMENRNTQLAQANDDLRNLLSNVNLPIVMVDHALRIRRFTTQAEKALSIIPSDTGRPIGNIRPSVNIANLEQRLGEVIETLGTHEAEVQDVNGRWYLLRIRPYRTEKNKIEGAVLVLVDIDDIKKTAEAVREARDFNRSLIETVRSPLMVLDSQRRVKFSNPIFYQTFKLSQSEVVGRSIYEIGGGQWNFPQFRSLLDELSKTSRLENIEIQHEFLHIGLKTLLINASSFRSAAKDSEMVLIAAEDVTERKRYEDTILRTNVELERKVAERTAELQTANANLRAEVTARVMAQTALEQSDAALRKSHEELRGLTQNLISAHEEERRRVSRELHDALNQRVAMLEMDVETVESNLPESAGQIRERLHLLQKRVREISNDVRRMAFDLHPSVLDDLGLAAALRSYATELSKRDGITVKFDARDVPESLPPAIALTLYRVAQEAILNVLKHAQTPRATVLLGRTNNTLELDVRDKGAGFDPSAIKGKGGLGLRSMEERVRVVNGQLQIQSRPGAGTRISVTIPLPASEEKKE